jgi:hypothetical protein
MPHTRVGSPPGSPPLTPSDGMRHCPVAGAVGRDSLYFNVTFPEHDLSLYLYTSVDHRGLAGRRVIVWGRSGESLFDDGVSAVPVGDMDFDKWDVEGMRLNHPDPLNGVDVRFERPGLELSFEFAGAHEAFPYSRNREGCPVWLAMNRFEQSGWARGRLKLGDRIIEIDHSAHRDHSWGPRNWRMPQHWKWIAAQTDSGTRLNLYQWIAMGETGTNGYVVRDGQAVPIVRAECRAEYHDDMTSKNLRATIIDEAGEETTLTFESFGSIALIPRDWPVTVNEAACRGSVDGEDARGIFETVWPTAYLDGLRQR